MKEMVGGCCVCSDERGWPENPLVYCDGQNCTVAVHQACYGIVTVPTGPWYCRKCESQERSTRVRCELCPSRDGALKKTDNQGWAHVVCALYIPEVRFGNVTTMEPIILQLIPQERYAKTCYICQDIGKPNRATVGACMQCNKSNCKQQFHVTCAQSLGLLCEEAGNYLDNVKYCGYCQHHYSKLKKGGNVKTIPPYKPITHDTSSDSGSSPEKEIDSTINATASSTSATSIKITTNISTSSSSLTSTKQRKSSTASKQSISSASSSTPTSSGNFSSTNSFHGLNTSSGGSSNGTSGIGIITSTSISGSSTVVGSSSNALSSSTSNSSTSILKNPLGSSSSCKDKEKHTKSLSKLSSSNKEKDSGSSSSSSRESRDKSSKSSKNKDISGTSSSTTPSSAVVVGTTSASNVHNNPLQCSGSTVHNFIPATTTGAVSGAKESTRIPPGSLNVNTKVIATDDHTSIADVNLGTSSIDKCVPDVSIPATTPVQTANTVKNPSTSSISKKRKSDTKSNVITGADDVNNTFRDIIKDVTVTLTPLQQTDFEKEIERSFKKQKTELSPPTHQSLNAEIISQSGNSLHSGNNSLSTNASSTTACGTTPTFSSSFAATSTLNATHKQTATDAKVNNLNSSIVCSSITTGNLSTKSNSTANSGNAGALSSTNALKELNREERYGTPAVGHSSIATVGQSQTGVAGNNANAPSLYVSVPLSTANVPGINLPSNNPGDHHIMTQSTRTTTQQQQHISSVVNKSVSSSAPLGSNSNGLSENQSPRIHHQSPAFSEHECASNFSTGSTRQSPSTHSVIHQSGKSSTSNVLSGVGNLTATTTESGNLKISFEKQTTRVSQLQEQESAPVRRSRSRSGESSGVSSQSHHQQLQQLQQGSSQQSSKSNSRSGKKRAAAAAAAAATTSFGTNNSDMTTEKLAKISTSFSATNSPSQQNFRSELITPPPTAPSPLSLPPPNTRIPTPTQTPTQTSTPTPTQSPSSIIMLQQQVSTSVTSPIRSKITSVNSNNGSDKSNDHCQRSSLSSSMSTSVLSPIKNTINAVISPVNALTSTSPTNTHSVPINNPSSTTSSISSPINDRNNNNSQPQQQQHCNSNFSNNSSSNIDISTGAFVVNTAGINLPPATSNTPLNKKLLRAQQTHYQQQFAVKHQQQQPSITERKNSSNNNKNSFNSSNINTAANIYPSSSSSSTSPSTTSNSTIFNTSATNQQHQEQFANKNISGIYNDTEITKLTNSASTSSSSPFPPIMIANMPQTKTTTTTSNSINNINNNNYPSKQTAGSVNANQSTAANSIHRTPDSGVFSSSAFNLNCSSNSSTTSSFASHATNNTSGSGLKFTYESQAPIAANSATTTTTTTIDANLAPALNFKDSPPSSPASEAGSMRKRGRKPKDVAFSSTLATSSTSTSTVSYPTQSNIDLKEVKVFQNGGINIATAGQPASPTVTGTPASILPQPAAHMLGNQINPNSNVAQKLSDQLHMEIQDHSIYTPEAVTPQYVGVPFPGKLRNSSTTTTGSLGSVTSISATNSTQPSTGANSLPSGINGSSVPQGLEQLLERQWEQGSQFLMEQAQHFDIVKLLSCLHQLQSENVRLEEHVTNLIARRDHLLAVNARLAIPLNTVPNTTQSQANPPHDVTATAVSSMGSGSVASNNGCQTVSIPTTLVITVTSANSSANVVAAATSLVTSTSTSMLTTTNSATTRLPHVQHPQQHNSTLPIIENGIDFSQQAAIAALDTTLSASSIVTSSVGSLATAPLLSSRQNSSFVNANYNSSPSITTTAVGSLHSSSTLAASSHNNNAHSSTHSNCGTTAVAVPAMQSMSTGSSRLPPQQNLQTAHEHNLQVQQITPVQHAVNALQHQSQQHQHLQALQATTTAQQQQLQTLTRFGGLDGTNCEGNNNNNTSITARGGSTCGAVENENGVNDGGDGDGDGDGNVDYCGNIRGRSSFLAADGASTYMNATLFAPYQALLRPGDNINKNS